MNTIPWVPITGVMGACIIGGLIYLICTLDYPVTAQYNRTVRDLYTADESLRNEADMLETFPELAAIKQKVREVRQLNLRKQDFFSNPAPIHSHGQAAAMVRIRQEINGRGGEISIMLDNFSTKMRLVTKNQ